MADALQLLVHSQQSVVRACLLVDQVVEFALQLVGVSVRKVGSMDEAPVAAELALELEEQRLLILGPLGAAHLFVLGLILSLVIHLDE